MIKKILAVLVVLIAAVLAFAATKPDTFHVERSATIQAPPEAVYPLIADFRNWPSWSPWEKLDPAMKRTFSGAPSGVGAVYAWQGNNDVGAGQMEITEANPTSKVAIRLQFLEPMESSSTTEFTLTPQAGGTGVTWAMHGPNPYLSKVMSVFMSFDKMIGKDFETGLANLAAQAEK